jgi:cyclopropane-fatty-acyl-phospholipid synthase
LFEFGEVSLSVEAFVKDLFRSGSPSITLPGGRRIIAGDGGEPRVAARVKDVATVARILAQPALGVGEAYMDGRLVIEEGSIHDLVDLATRPRGPGAIRRRPGPVRRWLTRMINERNARRSARRNVAHHYDLSAEFYRSFLDEDLQYSCAYFEWPEATLEEAQRAKKRHIAAKLALEPGHRVLDIGCGWGGLALSLAAWTGAKVDGVTLSTEQLALANDRAEAAGLAGRTQFSLTDYRDVAGPYDRIVSVGMFEHVGRPHYQTFFDKIAALLNADGVALIHSIGRAEGPSTTDPFTAKYIFPGGYIPALSEVLPAVERAGLWVTDIEILRLHYAETIRHWRGRFAAARARWAEQQGERFCRMWEFYLSAAEVSFRNGGHMNFQLQLTKRKDALPITRGYIDEAERALAARVLRAA